jgi:biotin-dependent carboxylase-like uncharacterized protein
VTRELIVREAGPAVTVQDLGRPGYIAQGLTRGGAMDRLALHEGAALLGQPVGAAIEMIGMGGKFEATEDVRIALTGAPMQASVDGAALAWNGSHLLPAGSVLSIGGVRKGAIGYLHLGGGIDLPEVMGSLSAHLAAGIGERLAEGNRLPLKRDRSDRTGWQLEPDDRFSGGKIRIVRSLQSYIFGEETLERFVATPFTRDARANRQGIRLNPEGEGFATEGGLTVVSEIIATGDIQITGDGAPYVLMCESQTTGGYPRIATIIPSDLASIAQAPLGAKVEIDLLDLDAAVDRERRAAQHIKSLPRLCQRRVRNPADMPDLLHYSLIGGAIDATRDPFEGDRT